MTTKAAFPLLHIQDCLDSVAGSTLFTTLDLISCYHQVKIKEEDIPKTASFDEYVNQVKELLERLREAKLKLKPEKCNLKLYF